MNITILYNRVINPDNPDEQDVIVQRDAIDDVLTRSGHTVISIACNLNLQALIEKIEQIKPDLVFNLVESLNNNGQFIHLVPTILENLGIPFTGSPANTIYLSSNKLLAKNILHLHKLPTAQWMTLHHPGYINQITPEEQFIIKSVWEHASLGLYASSVVRVDSIQTVYEKIQQKVKESGKEFFAEQYIDGREFNVSILETEQGPQVLPIPEIKFIHFNGKPKIVDYKAKWDSDSFEYHHTPRYFLPQNEEKALQQKLKDICLTCWKIFGLRGYARIDFRVNRYNQPYILEINANPCLSQDAGFTAACTQNKLPYDQMINNILQFTSMGVQNSC
jgi:D-alanine-D-alanine ligase